MGLKIEKHPKPCKLAWLKKGNEVTISQRALINFSIRANYKDLVWCDVVSMDACHLLLGRPWQYDRKIAHDDHNNTYSFLFNSTNIVLLLGKAKGKTSMPQENCNLLSFARFEEEMKDT